MEFIKSAIKKRSIFLRGQKTSISLEDAFWNAMKTIAQRRNISLGALIEGIDAVRNEHNLSSAIRVFVLEEQLEANRERTKH